MQRATSKSSKKQGNTKATPKVDTEQLGILFEALRDFARSIPEYQDGAYFPLFLEMLAARGDKLIGFGEEAAND